MPVLTIKPKTHEDGIIFSDGETSNKITLTVLNGSTPVASTPFTGTVTDASGRLTGTVSPASTDANGDIVLTIGAPPTRSSTLSLTLYQDAQTLGRLQLVLILFDPVTLTLSPSYLSAETPLLITANIKDDAGIPVGGLTLEWQPDASLKVPPKKMVTNANDPASFQYTLPRISQATLSAAGSGGSVFMTLTIGPAAGDFKVKQPLSLNPPLVAPTLMVHAGDPPVLDDSYIDACKAVGVPFTIPAIANSSQGDVVSLFSSPTDRPQDSQLLNLIQLTKDEAGKPFQMYANLKGGAFTTNGPEYVYYSIILTKSPNASTRSDPLRLEVDRQDVSDLPDGAPDSTMTNPQVTPVVYTVANYNNKDNLTATINANGSFRMAMGDVVTTKIYLVGYTSANMNSVTKIDSEERTLASGDFDSLGNLVPFNVTFASSLFAGIDGSNGQVYIVVNRRGAMHRSPSRSIVVDTVPAYSGSIARLLALP